MEPDEVIQRLTAVGTRAPLSVRELASMHREPVDAGAGEVPADIVTRATLGRAAIGLYQRPDWVAELAHKGVSVAEMLDEVHRRVLDDPHEETLIAAEMVVNDIARLPDGPALVARYVSADLISKLVPTDGGR